MNFLDGTQTSGNNIAVIVIIIVIAALLIGWMVWQSIRNKKQQKEAQKRVEALKPGDKIKTIGGICAYLVSVDEKENTFILETGINGKGTTMKFDKGAIYQIEPVGEKKEEVKEEEKAEKPSKNKKEKKAENNAEEKVEVNETPATETPASEVKDEKADK